ncbi:Glutamine synthetase [Diplonema papillatum]|nr:Glutamine synthetase [Diplonema papillatum]
MSWIAEYVWLSGQNTFTDLRSKYKTITNVSIDKATVKDMSKWNFDGSSTNQHRGSNTEIIIMPVAMYPHPFLDNAKVVLCECYYPDGTPEKSNTRKRAKELFDAHAEDEPMFGLEQEYFIMKNGRPLGWPENGYPAPQGDYYCGNGAQVVGREIVLEHYQACLRMGLKLSGVNAEVAPAQWEYQVGPCIGIEQGDHMVMSRWVYQKIGEKYGLEISYDAKPVKGDWNGTGCHTNFSTKAMREEGGIKDIYAACENLKKTFLDDVKFYGADNDQRMTGIHETSKLSEFTYGIGTRHTSVRIGNDIKADGKGYFEDRRPAAGVDPYLVTSRLYASSMGYEGGPTVDMLEPKAWWKDLEAEAAANAASQ